MVYRLQEFRFRYKLILYTWIRIWARRERRDLYLRSEMRALAHVAAIGRNLEFFYVRPLKPWYRGYKYILRSPPPSFTSSAVLEATSTPVCSPFSFRLFRVMADTSASGAASAAAAPPAEAGSPKKSKSGGSAAKKPRSKPAHPRTSEMVYSAIKSLKERGGSSLQAIKKYIAANYKVDSEKHAPFIKKYLKSAVSTGDLVQTKGAFFLHFFFFLFF